MAVLPAASVVVTLAVDGGVGIGHEVAAGDVDAEGAAGDLPGIGGAVDRQGDRVAVLDVAADRAGDRHVPPASAALTMLSAVMASSVMLAADAVVSTV